MRQGAYKGLTEIHANGEARWNGNVTLATDALDKPLHWRKPRRIFVNSMSDLFHENIPPAYVAAVFGVMAACPQHIFQVLTKRPERAHAWFEWMLDRGPAGYQWSHLLSDFMKGDDPFFASLAWKQAFRTLAHADVRWPLPNVWIGVSAENQETYDARLPSLMQIPAVVRWVSAEPLLGPIDLRLNLSKPDWVVVGGESGPGARECRMDWISDITYQCRDYETPVFVKQLGSRSAVEHPEAMTDGYIGEDDGPLILKVSAVKLKHPKGGEPEEWPHSLRIREYPQGGAS